MAFTFNGIGTKYYGEGDKRPDGSFVTTEWFTVFYIPLIPLRSFRLVRAQGNGVNIGVYSSTSYGVVEKRPLALDQVLKVYAFTVGSALWLWLVGWLLFVKFDEALGPYDGLRIVGFIMSGCAPFFLLWYLRRSAYRAKYGSASQ